MVRFLLTALLVGLMAHPALAANCSAIRKVKADRAYELNVRDVERCIQQGWDPPVDWRPDRGRGGAARVSGGGGFNVLTIQAPDRPPALRGYAPSVSDATIGFVLKFPPWKGFPCELPGGIDLCGGDDDDDDDGNNGGGGNGGGGNGGGGNGGDGDSDVSSCPMATDTSGTFGTMQGVGNAGSFALACGGAIPLTIYQMTLVDNPSALVATEHNSPYLWVYTRSGTNFNSAGEPLKLPTHLCKPTGANGTMEQSIAIAPRAQFVTYDRTIGQIAIRLIASEGNDIANTADPLSPDANKERYLMIPIRNNVPAPPEDCASEEEYLKPASAIAGHLVVETLLEPACEGTPAQCAAAGASTSPTAPATCDTAIVYLSGDKPETSQCADMTQMLVIDRPNLLLPPGSSARFTAVAGRTAMMATTVENSQLYLPAGNVLRVPKSARRFTLGEGGVLGMDQGKLTMYGPATIDAGSGQILLSAGGEYRDMQGNTITTYAANAAVRPTGGFPWLITANRNVTLPAGYALPSQPRPYIRAPIAKP